MGHSQNRLTTEGHVKQTDADNMWSFIELQEKYNYTQVCTHVHIMIATHQKRLQLLIAYVCFVCAQSMTLSIMAGSSPYSNSTASMWKQGYEVVKVAFQAYHADQGRDHPLLAARRFTSKLAKDCDPKMMARLLNDVSRLLNMLDILTRSIFVLHFFCVLHLCAVCFCRPATWANTKWPSARITTSKITSSAWACHSPRKPLWSAFVCVCCFNERISMAR